MIASICARLAWADAAHTVEIVGCRVEHRAQRAETLQQRAGDVEHIVPGQPGAQHERDQLGV
jgi:hypothetical protein